MKTDSFQVLDSGLIEASLKDHVVPIRFSEHMKCPPYTKIAEHLVELLFLGMDRLPTKAEKHLPNIDSVTTAIRVCPALYSEAAKATLERLEVLVMVSHVEEFRCSLPNPKKVISHAEQNW